MLLITLIITLINVINYVNVLTLIITLIDAINYINHYVD